MKNNIKHAELRITVVARMKLAHIGSCICTLHPQLVRYLELARGLFGEAVSLRVGF